MGPSVLLGLALFLIPRRFINISNHLQEWDCGLVRVFGAWARSVCV